MLGGGKNALWANISQACFSAERCSFIIVGRDGNKYSILLFLKKRPFLGEGMVQTSTEVSGIGPQESEKAIFTLSHIS